MRTVKNRLLALAFISSCSEIVEPEYDYVLHNPPSFFKEVYNWTWENCGIRERNQPAWQYEKLVFYIRKADYLYSDKTGRVIDNRVYLIEDALIHPSLLLSHELLHTQLGTGEHPPIFGYCQVAFDTERK